MKKKRLGVQETEELEVDQRGQHKVKVSYNKKNKSISFVKPTKKSEVLV